MLKGYLSKRLLLVSAAAVCVAIATPTILRRWMIEHFSEALNAPVSIGTVKIYPRSATIHATDITLGDERGPAYFKIAQSWLTWKNDSWSDGALRFRRAILDDVQVEAERSSHDYFGVFAQLQTQRAGELLPSIYRSDIGSSASNESHEHFRSTHAALMKYRSIWNQAKKRLSEASESLRTVLAQIEKSDQLRPNSLRERQELESAMKQAILSRQSFLQAKHQVLAFAERVGQIETELNNEKQVDIQRVQSELHLDEMIFRDLSERMLKEHCLAQTSVWLDYIATGRNLLGGMQLPQLTSNSGTDYHFASSAPEAETIIDELTLRGSLSLHHRTHDIFLRGFNLRSFPEPKRVTQVGANTKELAYLKPTVLRGEIKSGQQSLLFDFRRLWESQLQNGVSQSGFPQMTATFSDVITLECPAVGPKMGEMTLSPSVGLAWQGSSPWVWSQWRFDNDDKWRAKWVIRQEDLRFLAQDLSKDAKATATVDSISDYVTTLQRIDVEMDITCIDDQYAFTVTSNLEAWLPQIVKMVYRAEEQSQLEKVRTAIQQHTERELSLLREEVTNEQEKLSKDTEPALARLEKLSTDLASKLGVSPRVMLSQESEMDLKR
jgi:hypothetical protein